jgi:rare lipoprotein A
MRMRRLISPMRLMTLAAVLALACCAGPSTRAPVGHYKVGRPYQIAGRWYYPEFDPRYDRSGIASWYGDAFDGLATANGEVFDKDSLSAAHPTLPLPSIVRVTNLDNGRSLDVRVNDRGPFVENRLIDLSQAAARRLGFESAGLAPVRVTFLGLADDARGQPPVAPSAPILVASRDPAPAISLPPSARAPAATASSNSLLARTPPARAVPEPLNPATPPIPAASLPDVKAQPLPPIAAARAGAPAPGPFPQITAAAARSPKPRVCHVAGPQFVQVGAFADATRVHAATATLRPVGRVLVEPTFSGGRALARVKLGPLPDLDSGLALLDRVKAMGYPEASLIPVGRPPVARC